MRRGRMGEKSGAGQVQAGRAGGRARTIVAFGEEQLGEALNVFGRLAAEGDCGGSHGCGCRAFSKET
jgi:hypothetical protein